MGVPEKRVPRTHIGRLGGKTGRGGDGKRGLQCVQGGVEWVAAER